MKKYTIPIIVVLVILAAVIYYTGLYTYFVRTDIQEALPIPSKSTSSESSPSATNQTLATGNFVEVDFIHKGSGQAKLVKINDTNILRLENFNVVSGPDLYVYLSKSTTPTGDIQSLGDYIDLGMLKGTSGNQNYEINQDITGYQTAIIWCKRYGVLFTYALMK